MRPRPSPPLAATARQQQAVRWSHGLLVMINACFHLGPGPYNLHASRATLNTHHTLIKHRNGVCLGLGTP